LKREKKRLPQKCFVLYRVFFVKGGISHGYYCQSTCGENQKNSKKRKKENPVIILPYLPKKDRSQ
jgi:hypothetical protein